MPSARDLVKGIALRGEENPWLPVGAGSRFCHGDDGDGYGRRAGRRLEHAVREAFDIPERVVGEKVQLSACQRRNAQFSKHAVDIGVNDFNLLDGHGGRCVATCGRQRTGKYHFNGLRVCRHDRAPPGVADKQE